MLILGPNIASCTNKHWLFMDIREGERESSWLSNGVLIDKVPRQPGSFVTALAFRAPKPKLTESPNKKSNYVVDLTKPEGYRTDILFSPFT